MDRRYRPDLVEYPRRLLTGETELRYQTGENERASTQTL